MRCLPACRLHPRRRIPSKLHQRGAVTTRERLGPWSCCLPEVRCTFLMTNQKRPACCGRSWRLGSIPSTSDWLPDTFQYLPAVSLISPYHASRIPSILAGTPSRSPPTLSFKSCHNTQYLGHFTLVLCLQRCFEPWISKHLILQSHWACAGRHTL